MSKKFLEQANLLNALQQALANKLVKVMSLGAMPDKKKLDEMLATLEELNHERYLLIISEYERQVLIEEEGV